MVALACFLPGRDKNLSAPRYFVSEYADDQVSVKGMDKTVLKISACESEGNTPLWRRRHDRREDKVKNGLREIKLDEFMRLR